MSVCVCVQCVWSGVCVLLMSVCLCPVGVVWCMCSADAVAADTADSTPISSLDLIKFSFLRRTATSQVGLHHYSLLKMLAARTHIY